MRIRVRAAAPVSLGSSQSADIYHISQLCTITFYILQILHHHQIGWRVLPHSSIFLGYVSWGCSLHNEFTYTGWVIRCSLRKGAAQWIMRILLKILNYVRLTVEEAISNQFGFMRPSHHTLRRANFQKLPCLSRDACYWYMCDYVEMLKRLAFSFYHVGSCTFQSTSQSSILMNFMVLGRAGRWLICSITGRYAGRAIWSIAVAVVCPDSHFRWAAWRRGSHLYVTS